MKKLNLAAVKDVELEAPDFDAADEVVDDPDATIPMAEGETIPMADDEIPMAAGEPEPEEDDFARQEREAMASGLVKPLGQLFEEHNREADRKEQEAAAKRKEEPAQKPEGNGSETANGAATGEEADGPTQEEVEEFQSLVHQFVDRYGLKAEDAAKVARQEMLSRKSGNEPKSADEIIAELKKAAEQNQDNTPQNDGRQPAAGGSIGLVGALAAGVGALAKAPIKATSNLNETVRNRIYNKRVMQLEEGVSEMSASGKELETRIAEANKAFMSSSQFESLSKMAAKKGEPVEKFIKDINDGVNTDKEALQLMQDAEANPAVSSAWNKVVETTDKIKNAATKAALALGSLDRSFKDQFNTEEASVKMRDLRDDMLKKSEKSMVGETDEEGNRKKLMKRIEEMTEVIRKIFDRILTRLASTFRR